MYPYNFFTAATLLLYKFIWLFGTPFVVFYFIKRSLKEPGYRENIKERLGYGKRFLCNSIWVHAVSLGEFRASVPLIKEFLNRSEKIVLTTITPAGREEAKRILKSDIENGNVHLVYLPLEYDFAYNQFVKRCKPRIAIVLEIELWPVMISACSRHKIPLILAQGQYVTKSFTIDKRFSWLRAALFNGFDLILAKSEIHADRYKYFCNSPIEIMGELRFDQIIPKEHLRSAFKFLEKTKLRENSRLCFCLGSTGPGEDAILAGLMTKLTLKAKNLGVPKPFYIYVPRHKDNFSNVHKVLVSSGLNFVKRSEILDHQLSLNNLFELQFSELDGLIGDSLGEINFYFCIADYVFIGNSFNNLGSHNVIEPLALRKPVVVGPSVWGIEYPIIEALEARIIKKVENIEEFYEYWSGELVRSKKDFLEQRQREEFYKLHSGAVQRCIEKLENYGYLPHKINGNFKI